MHTLGYSVPSSGFVAFSFVLALLCGTDATRAQSYNFNNASDAGWMHYDPMASFGAPGSFTFPNGAYRIVAAPVPPPPSGPGSSALGPSRAASYVPSTTYSDFYESVDIVNWQTSTSEAFGLLAHLTTVGLQTTSGYALTFTDDTNELTLSSITSENPTTLVTAVVGSGLQVGHAYHLVFSDSGNLLSGSIYDNASPSVALASLSTMNSTKLSGTSGLVIYDLTSTTNSASNGADATFDNYFAGVSAPEPGSAMLVMAMVAPMMLSRRRARA
ncbi:MAG TPA: hypothetical protein VFW23_10645 [Tepidisphaeraceae bacterium]|nr:hypothetical protein [Tepidisphaeraceae bacterium]